MQQETTIQLPPPRRPDRRAPAARSVWLPWIFAALAGGLAGGIFVGKRLAAPHAVVVRAEAPASPGVSAEPGPISPSAPGGLPDAPAADAAAIAELLERAAVAVAAGNWLATRDLYREILQSDPSHPAALAALPLAERHLAVARASVRVDTRPSGALVRLGAFGEGVSPVVFEDVPYGAHEVVVSQEGYQPTRQVILVDKPSVDLADVSLVRGTGTLALSSVPEGVEFMLIKTDEAEELVQIGTTPAFIEQLDEGDYEVLMSMQGWPDYQEQIRVGSNRGASVSHIFARGGLNVTSDPSEAEVWLTTDASLPPERLGVTPLNASELPVGRHRLELRYRDWPPIQRTVEVRQGEAVDLDFAWKRGTVSFRSAPPGATVIHRDKPLSGPDGPRLPFSAEFPEGEHTFVAQYPELAPVLLTVAVEPDETADALFAFDYGSITIGSQPSGATVSRGGRPLGRTPFHLAVAPPGPQTFELILPRHRSATVSGNVMPGQSLNFDARLVFDPAPKTRDDFINSQGLSMIWVDPLKGWVGQHEVSQEAFAALMHKNPSNFQAPGLPVQGVSWYEAARFCEQLNASEGSSGMLPRGYRYGLPSDQVWHVFAGEAGLEAAVTSRGQRREGPAPSGSLPANEHGLHDTRGNLWEWCSDWYSLEIVNRARQAGASVVPEWTGTERKVLRGGSWNRSSDQDLHREYRLALRPSTGENHEVGFRVVLMPE